MKTLPLITATISLCALAAAPSLAQQNSTGTTMSTTTTTGTTSGGLTPSNKPMVIQNTSDGKSVFVLPPNASAVDKYKASWIFNNLSDQDVHAWEAQGYDDSTIKGAANLALRTDLPLEYILQQVRVTGSPLNQLAAKYGITTDNLNADLPGFGAAAISYASADMYAPPSSYAMNSTTTPMSGMASTGTASSASMPGSTMATPAPTTTAIQGDIIAVLSADPRFSTLVSAIRSAGISSTLQGPGPYTLFAPTNDAFSKLLPGTLDNLMKPENQAQLRAVLLYHVVNGKIAASDATAMSAPGTPKSLEGDTLTVSNVAPVKVNDATVTATDIPASNGVIHAIDGVLMPPTAGATAPAAPVPATAPAPAAPTPVTPAPAPAPVTPPAPAPAPGTPAPETPPAPAPAPVTPAPGTPPAPSPSP